LIASLLQWRGGGAQSSLDWRTHPGRRRVWKRVESSGGRGGNLLCGRLGRLTAQQRDRKTYKEKKGHYSYYFVV
jgi:hypothetical protein